MKHSARLLFVLGMLLVLLLASTALAQTNDSAQVRFMHAIPGAPPLDIYTNGQLTIKGLVFGAASTSIRVPASEHVLTVTQTGTTIPLWEQTITPTGGSALILVAVPTTPPSFAIYSDDLNPLEVGKTRFNAIHAIAGGPSVDLVLADGRLVLPALQFGQPATGLDIPAFTYDFAVVPAGQSTADALLTLDQTALAGGSSNVLVIYGTPNLPSTLLLSTPTAPEAQSGFVRLVHGVAGAPAVDIYVNDALIVPTLAFGEMTDHIAVPAGTYDVNIRVAGAEQSVFEGEITVEAGVAATAAALGTPDDVEVGVFVDDIAGMDATLARLSVINGVPGESSLTTALENGTELASAVAFGSASTAASFRPTEQGITVEVEANEAVSEVSIPAQAFYGGVYYNALVVDDGGEIKLFIAPTSIAQSIASAPGADTSSLVVQQVEPTAALTLAPPPTAAAPTTAPVVAVQPTAVPPASNLPTGRIYNLDLDRNLQLRQYPNVDALSLGTVPPGTIVIINGREGEIVSIPSSATPQPPEGYVYTDPVTLLGEREDLVPEATWLYITYTTPDGGTISAWANGLYIDVRAADGNRISFRELPTVPANQPGEVDNTAVTPPPIPIDRVAVTVINLDPDANLNIRRIPDVNGEVLARIRNGTVMEFLGIREDRTWVFVRYSPPEGGTVTGWVTVQYIAYSLNSRPIDLVQMEQRSLLVITPDTQRGEVTEGVALGAAPTANPVRDAIIAEVALDPGANLNLRRLPNAQSEVLAQIPSGTRLVVTARSGDGFWLNVEFEGTVGWIAARTDTAVFVRLTQNGRAFDFSQVPIVEGDTDTFVATVQPTPQAGGTPAPTLPTDAFPVIVNDTLVQMTGSPGGSADGLPIIYAGQTAVQLFTDGTFSYIELPDGSKGWVPATSLRPA